MSKSLAIIIGLILLAALLLFSMTFTVKYHEVAVKTRFGKVNANSVIAEPGLKMRLPLFADRVTTFDTRLQLRESPLETVQTAEGQQVLVKAFLLWRVRQEGDGPVKFFESYSSVDEANAALSDQFKTAMRSGISGFNFNELIGENNRLSEAETAIKDEMAAVRTKGIEPVSVGVSQLVLPQRTIQAVLTRMQRTREALSGAEVGKGQSQAAAVRSRAAADVEKIKAFAENAAAEIRATAEENAAQYIAGMAQEQELAIFLQSIEALKTSLSRYTTLILPASFAPFNFFDPNAPTNEHGIPQPSATQPGVAGIEREPAGVGMNSVERPSNPSNQEETDG